MIADQNASTSGVSSDTGPVSGAVDSEADHDTPFVGVEYCTFENAGSGVGETALSDSGRASNGEVLESPDSIDHSLPDDCSGIPVPNDIDAIWSGVSFMMESAGCQPFGPANRFVG